MSMNLHLSVQLFGRPVEIPLLQTPTMLTTFDRPKAEYLQVYLQWVEENQLDPDGDHARRVRFYCEHCQHTWRYG